MAKALTYEQILQELRDIEPIRSPEFFLRAIVLCLATILIWLISGRDLLLVWIGSYYTLVMLEKIALSAAWTRSSTLRFSAIMVLTFLISAAFCSFPVYIWFDGTDIHKFATLVLLVSAVQHIFIRRVHVWQSAVAALVPIVIAMVIMAMGFADPVYDPRLKIGASVLVVAFACYCGVAIFETHRKSVRHRALQQQFLHSQKVEALGTLTGGVAHDFNNLLSVIQGNLELLQTYPDAAEKDLFLKEALTATHRGADLTKRLMSYVNRAELSPRPLEPSDVLASIEALARRLLPPNISLSLERQAVDGQVYADETLLHSALLNLMVNARDAMPKGGRLTLRTRPAPREMRGLAFPDHMLFEVEDTGMGIAQDILPNVMDPFFSTKPKGQGSGLGLAMVSGFANQSGGHLFIDSTPNAGTIVRLALPLRPVALDHPVGDTVPV